MRLSDGGFIDAVAALDRIDALEDWMLGSSDRQVNQAETFFGLAPSPQPRLSGVVTLPGVTYGNGGSDGG